jgi:Glycosyl hydrolase family 59
MRIAKTVFVGIVGCAVLAGCNDNSSGNGSQNSSGSGPQIAQGPGPSQTSPGTFPPPPLPVPTPVLESPIGAKDAAVEIMAEGTSASNSYTIQPSGDDRVFDGIGGDVDAAILLHGYPEPQRSQILDYMFKPNYGEAVQVLKLEIGGDMNSTSGSESSHQHAASDMPNVNNGYETWMAQEALKRNPNIKIWGSEWGAPAWVRGMCTQLNANYVLNWLKGLKAIGVNVSYISAGQNERNCSVNSSIGSVSDTDNINLLRATFDGAGFTDVKLIGWDGSNMPNPPILNLNTQNAIFAVGPHYPGGWTAPLTWSNSVDTTFQQWAGYGIKFWTGEDTDFQSMNPPGTLTRQYNFRHIQSGSTLVMNWTLVGATYSTYPFMENRSSNPIYASGGDPPQMPLYAMEPWSGHYELIEPPFWSIAQTTQFTQPGWLYTEAATGEFNAGSSATGSIVTYRSAGSPSDWTSVIETTGASAAQTVKIIPAAGFKNDAITIFTSNDTGKEYFNNLGRFTLPKSGLTMQVQPNSIVTVSTLSGQSKGLAYKTAPASAPFPASYADNFESYSLGETNIAYFAPQQGAYEVQACKTPRILTESERRLRTSEWAFNEGSGSLRMKLAYRMSQSSRQYQLLIHNISFIVLKII